MGRLHELVTAACCSAGWWVGRRDRQPTWASLMMGVQLSDGAALS